MSSIVSEFGVKPYGLPKGFEAWLRQRAWARRCDVANQIRSVVTQCQGWPPTDGGPFTVGPVRSWAYGWEGNVFVVQWHNKSDRWIMRGRHRQVFL